MFDTDSPDGTIGNTFSSFSTSPLLTPTPHKMRTTRRATGSSKLIILDSFNNWNNDTQVEASESYGEDYLKIVREEFKTN